MKNETLLKVNDEFVTINDLAQAWIVQKERFTDAPWSNPESDLSPAEFARVSLIDLNEPGEDKIKANIKLPIRSTPSGAVNRNALRNAASRIFQVKGVPQSVLRQAAKRLANLMMEAGIEVGASLRDLGGIEKSTEWRIDVIQKADEKQIVYGVILRPDVPDSQGDVITAEEIEDAAHQYMAKYAGQADFLHKTIVPRSDAVMVESFIAPVDFDWGGFRVLKGDWIGGMWIPNQELWGMVKKGTINAFSIRGIGKREPVE